MTHQNPGAGLEEAVARIQAMLDPNSKVTRNERIVDRLGNAREFDVVIRGQAAGRPILGVVECKDWAAKVGTPELDAFITKARNINANLVLVVSRKGFTEPALTQARFEGIGTLSLLPEDPQHAGFSIGVTWYAKLYRWTSATMTVHLVQGISLSQTFQAENVLWQGRRVLDAFYKELSTTYGHFTTEGPFKLQLVFNHPRELTIEGRPYPLLGITLEVQRVCEKKKRWVRLEGDAFFDWPTGSITLPAGGAIRTEGFRSDFSDWQKYDDDIPEVGGFMSAIIVAFDQPIDPSADVVDMSSL